MSNSGTPVEAIKDRNSQQRKAISMLKSVLWDNHVTKTNKYSIDYIIIKSMVCYGTEV